MTHLETLNHCELLSTLPSNGFDSLGGLLHFTLCIRIGQASYPPFSKFICLTHFDTNFDATFFSNFSLFMNLFIVHHIIVVLTSRLFFYLCVQSFTNIDCYCLRLALFSNSREVSLKVSMYYNQHFLLRCVKAWIIEFSSR